MYSIVSTVKILTKGQQEAIQQFTNSKSTICELLRHLKERDEFSQFHFIFAIQGSDGCYFYKENDPENTIFSHSEIKTGFAHQFIQGIYFCPDSTQENGQNTIFLRIQIGALPAKGALKEEDICNEWFEMLLLAKLRHEKNARRIRATSMPETWGVTHSYVNPADANCWYPWLKASRTTLGADITLKILFPLPFGKGNFLYLNLLYEKITDIFGDFT